MHVAAAEAETAPVHAGSRDTLDAFLHSVRGYAPLPHPEMVELATTRAQAEAALRGALFLVPEVADALLQDWHARRASGRVTGVMAEDDGKGFAARTKRVDQALEAVQQLREQAAKHRGRQRVGLETQTADQLQSADLALELVLRTRRELPAVRGHRARAALERADRAIARWTEARGTMVRHNLRLVVSVATRYRREDLPLADLVQEGILGLVRAAEKFDPERGFRFSTYAVWWIEQALIRAIQKQTRAVRLPAHVHEQQMHYRRALAGFDCRSSEDASPQEVAERMGVETDDVSRIEASLAPIRSLDAPAGPDDVGTLGEKLEDDGTQDPTDSIARGEMRAVLEASLRGLSPRETTILARRFGLDGQPPQTLDAIGSELGLSRERVRQIERSVLDRLGEDPAVQALAEGMREEG